DGIRDSSVTGVQTCALPILGVWWSDRWCRRADRCGDPLAPGRSHLTAEILQDRAGEDRDFKRSLFLCHLGPGEYELGVRLGVVRSEERRVGKGCKLGVSRDE